MRSISKPFGALSETLELEWNQGKGEKELAKYNSNWIYWQGREKALCFSLTIFGDNFLRWIRGGKKLPFCCAHGCKCQMGVVDWEFDRHQHTFFFNHWCRDFPGPLSPTTPSHGPPKGPSSPYSCCCICLGSPVSNLPGVDPSPIFCVAWSPIPPPYLPYFP